MKNILLSGLVPGSMVCAMGTVAAEVHASENNEQRRPNILICVADDAGHFGAYGYDWVKTPNFDSVARKGVLFDNTFTCNAKSAPSRACMITGRNSWQLEEAANHWCDFPLKFTSFPEVLKKAGYATGYTGKGWGPGIAKNEDGTNRELTGKAYNKIKTNPPTTQINKIDYSANFKEFMKKRDKDKPFCFWYGAREPHRSYEYGSNVRFGKKLEDIDSVPAYWPDNEVVRTDMLDYAVEIEYFDNHLGKILAHLDSIGELDNTLVLVTSDHGMPFPRVKGQDYYYCNHIPMAVMWGNEIKNQGRRCDELVSVIDFAPTFLEAAGVDGEKMGMQPIEGQSFMDILRDEKVPAKNREVLMLGRERHDVGRPDDQGYPIRGMIKGDYLYLRNYEPERWPAGDPETGYMDVDGSPTKTEILKCRHIPEQHWMWELSMGKRGERELYNIKTDKLCMYDLSKDPQYRKLVSEMESEMESKLRSQQDPRMFGKGEIFDKYPNRCPSHDFWERTKAGEKVPFGWINESDFEK